MSDTQERHFHYYREHNGRLERWRFVLDQRNVFIRDERVKDGLRADLPPVTDDTQRLGQSAQVALLQQRGFEFEVGEAGNLVITKAPPLELEISKFFTLQVPCFFPECENLRAEWRTIMDSAGGTSCSDCEKGRLMNQFRAKLEAPLRRHLIESHGKATR